MGFDDRAKFQRFARGVAGFWSDNVCLLGHIYQRRYGYWYIPGCGDTASVFQLWRFFDDCLDDRNGFADEREYEKVYSSIITVCEFRRHPPGEEREEEIRDNDEQRKKQR